MNNRTNNKTVSIVVTTFNRAEYVTKAIDSCIAQTFACEIIVVDHGSTDNTPEVVASYGDKVRYIRRDKDFGPHFCWLDGVMNATSDFIHIQHDDDWIEPTFIEECMNHFTDEVGFVFTVAPIVSKDGTKELSRLFENLWTTGIHPMVKAEEYLFTWLVSPSALVYRKKDLIDGLYMGDLSLTKNHYHGVGPDCLITLLMCMKYKKFGYVNKPLAKFRSHEGSITIDSTTTEEKADKLYMAYDDTRNFYKMLKFAKDNNLMSPEARDKLTVKPFYLFPYFVLNDFFNSIRNKIQKKRKRRRQKRRKQRITT